LNEASFNYVVQAFRPACLHAAVLAASLIVIPCTAAQNAPERLPRIHGPAPPTPPAVVSRDADGGVTMRAVRLETPLAVDGQLDEEIYRTTPSATAFIQQEPHEGQTATEQTEAWIFFDGRNLYVAARCWDSRPEWLVATEMRRDHFNIYQNDNFTVILDTFYDRRSGVFFQVNPLSALRDQEVNNERDNNNDWNTVWTARAATFDRGWTVEIVIPFKSLRYRHSGPQVWSVNLRRLVRWKNEHSFLSGVPASYGPRAIYKLSSAATLVGVETPARSMNLEVKPFAISSVTTNLTAATPFRNRFGRDAGVDVKYGLTRGLIADLTYNTDFAQVEEDEQQVNLTRFSLFFPEKREFFLEGQGIFAFGGAELRTGPGGASAQSLIRTSSPSLAPILFFSRRIGLSAAGEVPIIVGGRVTGRAGGFTLGALDIQTNDAPAASAVSTNFSVLRVRRDVLRRSTIGLIATRRAPTAAGTDSNTAIGVDGRFAFFQDLTFNGYYAATRTGRLTAFSRESASYRAQMEYAADRYGLEIERLAVGRQFNPETGFLRRAAFTRTFGKARFSPRPASIAAIRKLSWEASLDYITDPRGTLETRETTGSFRVDFERGDQLLVDYTQNFELVRLPFPLTTTIDVPAGPYAFQNVRGQLQLGPQRRIEGLVTLGRGSFYGGDRTEAGYRGRLELSSRVAIEPGLSVNWIDLPQVQVTTRLVSARTIVAMNPRLFVSSFLQFNSTTESLSSSVRLKWEYKPLSDLFIVYSDGYNTDMPGPARLENRTFAVKVTRLLRF
jgi:hypothetical protein